MKLKLKPWQLVYVDADGIEARYIGETVSMPTPEGTIMVRKVPGCFGAEEVHVSAVTPVEAGLWYVHFAHVRGNKRFPTDVLRTDKCVPVSFDYVWNQEAGAFLVDTGGNHPSCMLIVAQVTREKQPRWTPQAWKHFGWKVEHMSSECYSQREAA